MTIRMLEATTVAALSLLLAVPAAGQVQAESRWADEPAAVVQHPADAAEALTPRRGDSSSRSGSPYRLSWSRDGLIFGAALLGSGLADRIYEEHPKLTEEELARFSRDDVLWFDRSATQRYSTDLIDLSNQAASVTLVAPLLLMIDPQMRSDWQAFGVMYLQTSLLAEATSGVAKELIPRHRPYVYNSDLRLEDRLAREPGKAFFSSAAAFAFARAVLAATFFSDHHPDSPLKPYVWGAALAGAGTVGYLRYASGIHYPSDVVVGAVVGSAIGYAVPRLHRVGGERLTVSPDVRPDGAGVAARITF